MGHYSNIQKTIMTFHKSAMDSKSFLLPYYKEMNDFLIFKIRYDDLWTARTGIEMFYLNTIERLYLFVEQLDQLEVCLPDSRLLTGIPILAVFQNLRWNSNKTSLFQFQISLLSFRDMKRVLLQPANSLLQPDKKVRI